MSVFFKSKWEYKHRLETSRERRIQAIQEVKKCSREYAVRYTDYEHHLAQHSAMRLLSSALFTAGTIFTLNKFTSRYAILNKPWIYYPIIGVGFYTGYVAYQKLTCHYLNWEDRDVSHILEIDYEEKYKVKHDEDLENWEKHLALIPFERAQQSFV